MKKTKTAKQWQNIIIDCMKKSGTFRDYCGIAIDTLSQILERRDKLEVEFAESGQGMLVEHTNKAGSTNLEQNPMIRMINDLNRDALTYMRELGITPKGLKMIDAQATKAKTIDPFEAWLNKFEQEMKERSEEDEKEV